MTLDPNRLLDYTGWQLLRELQQDARITYAELGRRVGLSLPAIAERIRKMEEAGIITGYRAEVDPAKIGYPVTAFIWIRTAGEHSLQKMKVIVPHLPEVLECYHLTGVDYFIIKVVVDSIQGLEQVIERLQPYGQTTTSIVLSTLLTRQVLGGEAEGEVGAQTGEREGFLPLKARISRYRPSGK
jgi:Lrp/AsnC family leucine-responsive transcriptional regulator